MLAKIARRPLLLVATAVVLAVSMARFATGAAPVSFQELEESLTCQCGCGLTVHSCNHLQCPSALPLRDEIRSQMEAGKGKEAILEYFAAKYGEKILSAPTTAGFNILAWVMPFVLVGVGGLVIAFTLSRWRKRTHPPAAPPGATPAGGAAAPAYNQALERELKNFDG